MDFAESVKKFTFVEAVKDFPLGRATTLRVGGNADYLVETERASDVKAAAELCADFNIPLFVLGGGSNLVVSDGGFRGVALRLKNAEITLREGCIHAGAGAKLSNLIAFCENNAIKGYSFLAGIPATVGGATYMNVGAFNHSFSDLVLSVTTVKGGKLCKYKREECAFSYRKSRFSYDKKRATVNVSSRPLYNPAQTEIIISVDLKADCGNKKLIIAEREDCFAYRKISQPSGRTCGSVFKNPKGYYAGELIEKVGLKGYTVGGAKISEKHANFIVNVGGGTAKDVASLIEKAKTEVYGKFGITLSEEIEYLGDKSV